MKSYRTEIDPNNQQVTACLNHSGAARWAYNWGLKRKMESYQAGLKVPSAIDLHRELNSLKKVPKEDGGVPWLYEVSKCVPQGALRNLDVAYKNFFQRCKNGAKKKGFPKFKSKRNGVGSFTLNGSIGVTARSIQLPRLGTIRLKETGYFPVGVRVISATVSEKAGRWFVSILTDEPEPLRPTGSEVLGVDVGIKSLAVLSDGTVFENPKALKKAEKSLAFLQRRVSKKVKGSNRRLKAVQRLARQHYRVSCVRTDSIHKATSAITKRAGVLGVEFLNIAGMMKNHRLAGALGDAGLSEFHRQLGYKLKWHGGTLVKADRFYPSSKTCSRCGVVKDSLSLSERTFRCDCGLVLDRDLNAAINLKQLAASSAVTARGGLGRTALPTKREPNFNQGLSLVGSV